MVYATVDDVAAGFRVLSADERDRCSALLEEAAVLIDSVNSKASADAKKVVSCRMVRRGLISEDSVPMGATQGSMSALGYSQSWTMSGGGSAGELYLSKQEKRLLGANNRIGSYSPLEDL